MKIKNDGILLCYSFKYIILMEFDLYNVVRLWIIYIGLCPYFQVHWDKQEEKSMVNESQF